MITEGKFLSVKLPGDLKDRLLKLAKKESRSLSSLIVWICEKYLNKKENNE